MFECGCHFRRGKRNTKPDRISPMQVITTLVLERSETVDPKPTLSLVPQATLNEFWLPLTAFHLGESAKNGCQGLNCLVVFNSGVSVFVDQWVGLDSLVRNSVKTSNHWSLKIGLKMSSVACTLGSSWRGTVLQLKPSRRASPMQTLRGWWNRFLSVSMTGSRRCCWWLPYAASSMN